MATISVTLVFCLLLKRTSAGVLQNEIRIPPMFTDVEKKSKIYFHTSEKAAKMYKLPCKAAGTPQPKYQWQKDGVDLVLEQNHLEMSKTTGDLTISNTVSADEGKYRCLATTTYTNNNKPDIKAVALSSITSFILTEIVVVSDADADVIAEEENQYTYHQLLCEPFEKASGRINRGWKKTSGGPNNKGDIVPNNRRYIDTTGTLHFIHLALNDTMTDENYYRCGLGDDDSDVIWLLIRHQLVVKKVAVPIIGVAPQLRYKTNQTFELHTNATLECVFSGFDPQQPIPETSWLDQGGEVITTTPDGKYTLVEGSFNRRLLIKNISESDEKLFHCQGRNSINTVGEAVKLDIVSVPIFTKRPQYQTVVEGTDAVFYCDARSTKDETAPDPPIWYINGMDKWPLSGVYLHDTKNHIVIPKDNKSLIVNNVTKEKDIMCVQCSVTNKYGTSWENGCLAVILGIIVAPFKENQVIQKGDIINLTVTATTDSRYSTLNKKWTFKNKEYEYEDIPHATHQDGKLSIDTSSLNDAEYATVRGVYTLRVFHKDDEKIVKVTVTDLADDGSTTQGTGHLNENGQLNGHGSTTGTSHRNGNNQADGSKPRSPSQIVHSKVKDWPLWAIVVNLVLFVMIVSVIISIVVVIIRYKNIQEVENDSGAADGQQDTDIDQVPDDNGGEGQNEIDDGFQDVDEISNVDEDEI